MRRVVYLTLLGVVVLGRAPGVRADELSPLALFEQRILPIFKSPNPSSCVQCHLSSVDLKDYILPSSRDTFLSLREQGLIDVEHPEQSKILHWISMGERDTDKLARRINAKNRKAEYEAFSAWIVACCGDQELLAAKAPSNLQEAHPPVPLAVIRHARKDRILDSFVRNIWSQRMRCFPCHTPDAIDQDNPLHQKAGERHRDFVKQYGQRMNLFRETPEATLQALITNSRKPHGDDLPLINIEAPLQSLLLLKPTAKVPAKTEAGTLGKPSSKLPVTHMGGLKMHKDDQSYKAFAGWLQDYSRAVKSGYRTVEELPQDNWFPTNHVLRIKEAPSAWPAMATIQLFVYAWDSSNEAWQAEPVAFTQSKITPRRMINGSLFLLASDHQRSSWQAEGETLPPGRYLVKAFLDHDRQIEKDPTKMLNAAAPDGSAEISAEWQEGFKNAQVISGSSFQ